MIALAIPLPLQAAPGDDHARQQPGDEQDQRHVLDRPLPAPAPPAGPAATRLRVAEPMIR